MSKNSEISKDDPPNNISRIDSIEPVASTKWLALQTISYTDPSGVSRTWDMVTRTTKPKKESGDSDSGVNVNVNVNQNLADAVTIIPILQHKNSNNNNNNDDDDKRKSHSMPETLLVKQFRPPMGRTTIEFPAGLIDKNETPAQAAVRELREETGYVGEFCSVQPQVSREICMNPSTSDTTAHIVIVEVDLDNPYNRSIPEADLEEGGLLKW